MMTDEIKKNVKPGARVRVWEKVKEGDKERLARFEGLVIARKHGSEPGATFTVRTSLAGVGVEKIYPLHSPVIEKVEIIESVKKPRRAKLYYVRELSKKDTKRKLQTTA